MIDAASIDHYLSLVTLPRNLTTSLYEILFEFLASSTEYLETINRQDTGREKKTTIYVLDG